MKFKDPGDVTLYGRCVLQPSKSPTAAFRLVMFEERAATSSLVLVTLYLTFASEPEMAFVMFSELSARAFATLVSEAATASLVLVLVLMISSEEAMAAST